jgi:oxygen-independent coproporphyrinogen-3 oxidase
VCGCESRPSDSSAASSLRTVDGERDLRSRHNLGYWLGRDYLGIGVGAVSTVGGLRWRNAPSLPRYLASLTRGEAPQRELEPIAADVHARERVLLGLRLDEPLRTEGLDDAIDQDALTTLEEQGLVVSGGGSLSLTPRGRFLGGGVTAELLD